MCQATYTTLTGLTEVDSTQTHTYTKLQTVSVLISIIQTLTRVMIWIIKSFHLGLSVSDKDHLKKLFLKLTFLSYFLFLLLSLLVLRSSNNNTKNKGSSRSSNGKVKQRKRRQYTKMVSYFPSTLQMLIRTCELDAPWPTTQPQLWIAFAWLILKIFHVILHYYYYCGGGGISILYPPTQSNNQLPT